MGVQVEPASARWPVGTDGERQEQLVGVEVATRVPAAFDQRVGGWTR
ncbi:MAG: hypothetical protein AVDCRST_MAG60-42 [uncultured Nocardioides sp.]|uniref:Uncharacterized protein n=1 Tax=uncultured Nocardioides sp. TaxID=198441 RepID=A0A6J4N228_9ACTN|nr:MAG: hypothetical protein AVDCRST_MAG60-42 [uncultured Nocardioides sp.]